ncbi:MAG: DNA alkylation repair protein [Candidatus Magasanikbacteria bacterium]
MTKVITNIRKELNKHVDPVYKKGATNFFKEKVNPIGVRTPMTRRISKDYFPKEKSKQDVFKLCEELLEKRTFEETVIAFSWARRMRKDFQEKDFKRFEAWLKKYVDNWAFCDDFCTHTLGEFITDFPEFVPNAKAWHTSKNRWLRRASAVSFIYPIRKEKKFLEDIFEIADKLLLDEDDLVQKGYGWTLKVAADIYPKIVFDFVMKRKDTMPRTALRYAIEKMPTTWRKAAMR